MKFHHLLENIPVGATMVPTLLIDSTMGDTLPLRVPYKLCVELLPDGSETYTTSGFAYTPPQDGERWFPAPSAPRSRCVALSQFRFTQLGKFRIKVKLMADGFQPVDAVSEVVTVEDKPIAPPAGEEKSKSDG